jgi:hypothetical protein
VPAWERASENRSDGNSVHYRAASASVIHAQTAVLPPCGAAPADVAGAPDNHRKTQPQFAAAVAILPELNTIPLPRDTVARAVAQREVRNWSSGFGSDRTEITARSTAVTG